MKIKYSSMVIAAAFARAGVAFAADRNSASGDAETETGKKAGCVADCIPCELEEDQKDR
jgi:hypothetical protein